MQFQLPAPQPKRVGAVAGRPKPNIQSPKRAACVAGGLNTGMSGNGTGMNGSSNSLPKRGFVAKRPGGFAVVGAARPKVSPQPGKVGPQMQQQQQQHQQQAQGASMQQHQLQQVLHWQQDQQNGAVPPPPPPEDDNDIVAASVASPVQQPQRALFQETNFATATPDLSAMAGMPLYNGHGTALQQPPLHGTKVAAAGPPLSGSTCPPPFNGHATNTVGNKSAIPQQQKSLADYPWFGGTISGEDVDVLLVGEAPGTFIVRPASSRPDCFTACFVGSDSTLQKSLLVRATDSMGNVIFHIEGLSDTYVTLPDLVQAHAQAFLKPLPRYSWFMSSASREEAERKLLDCATRLHECGSSYSGAYLVRASSRPGCWALSVFDVSQNAVAHFIITPVDSGGGVFGGYQILEGARRDSNVYSSLQHLVRQSSELTNYVSAGDEIASAIIHPMTQQTGAGPAFPKQTGPAAPKQAGTALPKQTADGLKQRFQSQRVLPSSRAGPRFSTASGQGLAGAARAAAQAAMAAKGANPEQERNGQEQSQPSAVQPQRLPIAVQPQPLSHRLPIALQPHRLPSPQRQPAQNQSSTVGSPQPLSLDIPDVLSDMGHSATVEQQEHAASSAASIAALTSRTGSVFQVRDRNATGGLQSFFRVQLICPNGETALLEAKETWTVSQLKEALKRENPLYAPKPVDAYVLKSPDGAAVPPIAGDSSMNAFPTTQQESDALLVQNLYVDNCRNNSEVPKLRVVEKQMSLSKDEKRVNVEIGALIGTPLCWTNAEDSEVDRCRSGLQYVRYQLDQTNPLPNPVPPPRAPVSSAAGSEDIIADNAHGYLVDSRIAAQPARLKIRLPLIDAHTQKVVEMPTGSSASEAIEFVFQKFYADLPAVASDPTKVSSCFFFKIPGYNQYVYGPMDLRCFDCIRKSMLSTTPLAFHAEVIMHEFIGHDETQFDERYPPAEMIADPQLRYVHSEMTQAGSTAPSDWMNSASNLIETPSSKSLDWDAMAQISLFDLTTKSLRLKIVGAEQVHPVQLCPRLEKQQSKRGVTESGAGGVVATYVSAGIFNGGNRVCAEQNTIPAPLAAAVASPRWYEWLEFTELKLADVPRTARVCLTLWGIIANSESSEGGVGTHGERVALGWVNLPLFDHKSTLRTGLHGLNMWNDGEANPIGTCVPNNSPSGSFVSTLFLEFDEHELPVVFPTEDPPELIMRGEAANMADAFTNPGATKASQFFGAAVNSASAGDPATRQRVDTLIQKDPLYQLSQQEKDLLWSQRDYMSGAFDSNPDSPVVRLRSQKALPKLLKSVPMSDRAAVATMHAMLESWPAIATVDALELLDAHFSDPRIRSFAVDCLDRGLDDEGLLDYLLQLVQVLKYESYHDNALFRFLLRRALRSRQVGHALFWYLRAEMHVAEISERFGLYLEAYLRGCGSHRQVLQAQTTLVKDLVRIANGIKGISNPQQRLTKLRADLSSLKVGGPSGVELTLDPSIVINGMLVEKCKFMDSAKLPLWLVCTNADNSTPEALTKYIIFKSGDDLRQDMLTLQLLRLMDKMWQSHGMDLELKPYGCVSTGDEEGMIEVVLNAETMASITRSAGGATAAFKADPLANWLREHNPTDAAYEFAVEKFVKSCAGYCVATYVLGIGDRHNDNVMVTRDGALFHIDFGHFLGNFKKKFGMKRERAPFVFTPDMAYVMGGRDAEPFKRFVQLSCDAYNIVRRQSSLFINLMAMMLSTGIPELQTLSDLEYLRNAFALNSSDSEAAEKFRSLIFDSLATKTTQINNAIHILAH